MKYTVQNLVCGVIKTLFLSLAIIANTHFAYAQTASILPPGKTTFFDSNGNPLTGGKVTFYIPGTTTLKTTWQDAGQTIPNTNPVTLDSAGRAIIYGNGSYQQVVRDAANNIIWNVQTASAGSSGGGGGSATVGDGQPVGSIQLWAGFVAPAQYAFAYGQEFTRAGFPELLAAITINQNVTCTTGSPTLTSVSATEQLSIGSKIESTCLNPGATIISKTASAVTASANAIISTTSSARFFPWGNGDGTLTFNAPDYRGRVPAGRDNMGGIAANRLTSPYINADGVGATSGSQAQLLSQSALPNVTIPLSASGSASVNSSNTYLQSNLGPQSFLKDGTNAGFIALPASATANISNVVSTGSASVTGNTASINGNVSQTPFPLIQPTAVANYVIKTTPDTNSNSYFGVASIGGMYGVLTCGPGLECAGNQISAVASSNLNCGNLGDAGSACTANTGASGHTVPFLDGSNTFSGSNAFPTGVTISGSAASLVGRPSATTGPATDFTIQSLVARGAPDANNDKLVILDNSTGSLKFITPGQIASSATAGVSSLGGQTGALTCSSSLSCASGNITLSNMGSQTVKANVTSASAAPANVSLSTFAKSLGMNLIALDVISNIVSVSSFQTVGYYAIGDGGSGFFNKSLTACPGTSGGGGLTDAAGNLFCPDLTKPLNVMAFGAKGDNSTFDWVPMQIALDAAQSFTSGFGGPGGSVYCPPGKTFKINGSLILDNPISFDCQSFINYTPSTGDALAVGKGVPRSTAQGYVINLRGVTCSGSGSITTPNPSGTVGVRLYNMAFSKITLDQAQGCSNAAFYCDGTGTTRSGQVIQHNLFNLGQIVNSGYGVLLDSQGAATSSCQANQFNVLNAYQNYINFQIDKPGHSASNSNTFEIQSSDNATSGVTIQNGVIASIFGSFNVLNINFMEGTVKLESGVSNTVVRINNTTGNSANTFDGSGNSTNRCYQTPTMTGTC